MNNKIVFSLMFLLIISIAQANITANDLTISKGETATFNISFLNENETSNITFTLEEFTSGNNILTDNFTTQTTEVLNNEQINFTIEVQTENAGNYTGIFNAGNESKNISLIITESTLTVPNKISFIGEKNSVNVTTFNITNTGSEYLENLEITTTLTNYTLSPNAFINLNPGETQTFTLEIALIKTNLGTITISNNKVNETIDVEATLRTGIEVRSLDIDVGGRTDKNVQDGDTITKDAAPGDEINFEFELRNTLDIDINDALLEITLENIDDGDDKIIDETGIDINSDDYERFELSYTLPNQLDDDKYTLRVHAEGEDDNGKTQELDWTLTLKIKKERHQVILEDTYLSPSTISCSQTTALRVNLVNAGRSEEDVQVIITNNELNIEREKTISLDDRGRDATRNMEFLIKTEKKGQYQIAVDIYMNNKLIESEVLILTVRSCDEKINTKKIEEGIKLIANDKGTEKVIIKENFRESASYLWILGSIVTTLLIIILIMLLI